jgi:hypothetical protein
LELRREGTGGWRKLLDEELLYIRMRKMRSVYKVLIRKRERKIQFEH